MEARDILTELKKRDKEEDLSDYQFAVIYVGLGETETSLQALEQAYHAHLTMTSYMKVDPRLDVLRGNVSGSDSVNELPKLVFDRLPFENGFAGTNLSHFIASV